MYIAWAMHLGLKIPRLYCTTAVWQCKDAARPIYRYDSLCTHMSDRTKCNVPTQSPLPERTHTTLTLHSTEGLTGRAAHALQVLLGLSDADLAKILMDPIAAIRREFQR